MVRPGRYRHSKGQEYEVLGVATHSETEEEFVVYRALYGQRGLWIRPLVMFSRRSWSMVTLLSQDFKNFRTRPMLSHLSSL